MDRLEPQVVNYSSEDVRRMNFAMRLSFAVGIFMLGIKLAAFYITGSVAILSDVAESVVHIFAVGFAAFSMWLSMKPADDNHPYGHDKISFFSAGFEGAMIALAALYIVYQALQQWIHGIYLQDLDLGIGFVLIAMIINGALGGYLIRKGKKYRSIVLVANGKHVLTDSWTSAGVVLALLLTKLTGWMPLDPIIAILIAANILWTGSKLVRTSVGGLMDAADPKLDKEIKTKLDGLVQAEKVEYHCLRYRNAGSRLLIDFHVLFSDDISLIRAHEIATRIEVSLQRLLKVPCEITTHLEPKESHDKSHHEALNNLN